ncbi:MAG: glyoxalase, partial [Rhizobiales bacterium]|nr:glyoxalase [Hyphomicrobiales bacterium]
MIQVKRLAHATFTTPDLEKQLDYWTRIMGLAVVERDARRAILASRLGQESVVLEKGD